MLDLVSRIKCPLALHFAAEDKFVPEAAREQVKAAFAGNPNIEIYVYPGAGHGFHCDERGSFHEASAKTAWQRAMDFLKKHLKK
jgi:carboxymethylenebutenolidase